MANIIDHSMEKKAAFIAKLQEYDFNHINSFRLCCLCNDIYLKDYNYNPQLNKCGQIIHLWTLIHLWTHKDNKLILKIDDIRFIIETYIVYAITELQGMLLTDALLIDAKKCESHHKNLQRKIQMCSEICIMLNSGVVFKEFIDCYKNSYFN
jgi:hypothetical protein